MNDRLHDYQIDASLDQLLDTVFRLYGCDFRSYALPFLWRRIMRFIVSEGFDGLAELHNRVLRSEYTAKRLLAAISVNVTEMFRDPKFFLTLRSEVVPRLASSEFIRIWAIGCADGQEAYSIATIFEEELLQKRYLIYATDINREALTCALSGVYPMRAMRGYTNNYIHSGGKRAFSEYYSASFDNAILSSQLKRKIVFAQHNVATDPSFNTFDLIVCRNVLIYFNRALQLRVYKQLYDSLSPEGILALGPRETLSGSEVEEFCDVIHSTEKFYQKAH